MKKLILFCSFISLFLQVMSGQNDKPISKGHLLTGGSLAFSFENNKTIYPSNSVDHAEKNWNY